MVDTVWESGSFLIVPESANFAVLKPQLGPRSDFDALSCMPGVDTARSTIYRNVGSIWNRQWGIISE